MWITKLSVGILLAIDLTSCGVENQQRQQAPQPSTTPSAQLSESNRKRLFASLIKISKDMSVDQVINLTGKPTHDDVVGPKKTPDKKADNSRRTLTYDLALYGSGGNTFDQTIYITFGYRSKKLLSIEVFNVPEFSDDSFICSQEASIRKCVRLFK
jgi:hypothetical protein